MQNWLPKIFHLPKCLNANEPKGLVKIGEHWEFIKAKKARIMLGILEIKNAK